MNLDERDNKITLSPKLLIALLIQTITIVVIIMQSYGNVKQDISLLKAEIQYLQYRLDRLEKDK